MNRLQWKLWAGCVSHLLVGRRFNDEGGGSFKQVTMQDVRQRIAEAIEESPHKQRALGMLPPLISALKDAVRAAPNRRAALVFRGGGTDADAGEGTVVDVHSIERGEGREIPHATVEKFWASARRKL